MDSTQHSITNDITAQRQTLRTSDTAPDQAWREQRRATVHRMTATDRFVITFMTSDATATIQPSGVLTVECDRATVEAIRSDFDVVGWTS